MKKLILIPVLFISVFVVGQIKGSNTIKVTLPYSTDSIFSLVGSAFLNEGFALDVVDRQFKSFKASFTPKDYKLEISANIKDSTVTFSGAAINVMTFKIEYGTSKLNITHDGFKRMDKVAKSLNGIIIYEKKK